MIIRDAAQFVNYRIIVVDMDGTLYFQLPMRVMMALELALWYGIRPGSLKELSALRAYRKLNEKPDAFSSEDDIYAAQLRELSARFNQDEARLNETLENWMQQRPLKWARRFRNKKLIAALATARERGSRVVVFSDYPAAEKTKAVGLAADGVYCAKDKSIGALKPSPNGLFMIARDYAVSPDEMLVIGDRIEKDGLCAEVFGADFFCVGAGLRRGRRQ